MMTKNHSFGAAINALKEGHAVSREGWNGKNMLLWLNLGSAAEAARVDEHTQPGDQNVYWSTREHIEGVPVKLFALGDKGTVTRIPNINMSTASGSTVTGWLASQTDMLAEDWCIHPLRTETTYKASDDDLDEPLGKACQLGDTDCESCQ